MKIKQEDTAIENYHNLIEGEFEATQNAQVYNQIKKYGSMTGGMISFNLGFRISDTGRCLNSLKKQDLIERAFKDKCQISKVKVWYWQIKKKKEPAKPGVQLTIG